MFVVCTFLLSGSLDRLYRVGAHVLVVVVVCILLLQFVHLWEVLCCRVEGAHAHVGVCRRCTYAGVMHLTLHSFRYFTLLGSHEDWRKAGSVCWAATDAHAAEYAMHA